MRAAQAQEGTVILRPGFWAEGSQRIHRAGLVLLTLCRAKTVLVAPASCRRFFLRAVATRNRRPEASATKPFAELGEPIRGGKMNKSDTW